jgi:hypothetical protein
MSLARRSALAVFDARSPPSSGRLLAVASTCAAICASSTAGVTGIFSSRPASRRPARFSNTAMNAAGSSFLTAARRAAEYTAANRSRYSCWY